MFAPACGTDDPCKDVECGTNGTCFEGACVCNEGFEGSDCNAEWAAKFVGSYFGSDVCAGTTFNLTKAAVVTRTSESTVTIANFAGFDSVTKATIKRENTSSTTADVLNIDDTDPAGRKFLGTAKISGSAITGSYRVTYSDGTFDDCTFNYTK